MGADAPPFLEQDPAPIDDGELRIIEANGGGAPMIGTMECQRPSPKASPSWLASRRGQVQLLRRFLSLRFGELDALAVQQLDGSWSTSRPNLDRHRAGRSHCTIASRGHARD